jgi:hypothetical protein
MLLLAVAPVPQMSIGFGSVLGSPISNRRLPQNRILMSCLILFKMAGPVVEWAKCFKQLLENFEPIVPVFYAFCIVYNSGHSF